MCHLKSSDILKKVLPGALLILLSMSARLFAQEDLLNILKSETVKNSDKVIATFKGDKIINVETNETVRRRNLDFRVSHLFGNIGKESGGGVHNFYGFDQSADIRIGFNYGISDKFTLGVSHLKRNEVFEGLLKYRIIQQTLDNSIPLAITFYSTAGYSIKYSNAFDNNVYRLSYNSQLIFSRKFSPEFSLVAIPGYVHRNFVMTGDENNTFSLSGGLRFKFTKSASVIVDYSHTFGRKNIIGDYYDAAGFGVEIETGGHVFSLMFTNASGVAESDYLLNTQDSWTKGGYKFSFIISRMFRLGKENSGSELQKKK